MKNLNYKNFIRILTAVILVVSATACSDYLNNPVKDRETGDDISLLILDFNFFNTRISIKLNDAKTGELIMTPVTVQFTGDNGNDIVTFSGEKRTEYNTTQGQLEVTVDPNFSISENTPLKFAVNVQAEGYNSINRGFQFQTEGKKTIEVELLKTDDEEETETGGGLETGDNDTTFVITGKYNSMLKSAKADEKPFRIQYAITLQNMLKFKDNSGKLLFDSSAELMDAHSADPDNFIKLTISKYSDYKPETDVVDIDGTPVSLLFHKLETGKLTKLVIAEREVADLNGGTIKAQGEYTGMPAPDLFGFAGFNNDRWFIHGSEYSFSTLNFSYTLVKAFTEPLCTTGSKITFRSDIISSFSIDADVYDTNDNLLTTVNFKGSFPETFTVENTPDKAVKLVFRNNNPSFIPLPPLEIANFCSGNYEVKVSPAEGYKEYQIVLKAFCPNNPTIAVAPTYSGEYKIKGSNQPWQGTDMTGGVVDILGLPNQEYEYRLLWENNWEYSTLVTEFDKDGNYLHPSGSKIKSEKLADGRIRINMIHHFSQNICDDLGW